MAKYERTVTGDFRLIYSRLNRAIADSAVSINLVGESRFSCGETSLIVSVYDKYYMRNSSRASLTLTVAGCGDRVFVSAIGAGGGQGVFLNFSWGAEENFVAVVEQAMADMGY